jgi:hypothetical protein
MNYDWSSTGKMQRELNLGYSKVSRIKDDLAEAHEQGEKAMWELMRHECCNLGVYGKDKPYLCILLDNGHNEDKNKCTYSTCPLRGKK